MRPSAFGPTMGALHQGHAALIRGARQQGGRVLVSVFVNPLQFGPNEDFARYPRRLDQDHALALAAGADALWAPQPEDLFPCWCSGLTQLARARAGGQSLRSQPPRHFEGVCTVVSRLLALVQPSHLHLGEKDWQQLQVLRRLVRDLNWPVQIVPCPTLREGDGLPLSSAMPTSAPSSVSRPRCCLRRWRWGKSCWLPAAAGRALASGRARLDGRWRLGCGLSAAGGPASAASAGAAHRTCVVGGCCPLRRGPPDRSPRSHEPFANPCHRWSAGAGKSTVTRQVARQLGLTYLDTGAMYRGVTWLLQQRAVEPQEGPPCKRCWLIWSCVLAQPAALSKPCWSMALMPPPRSAPPR